MFLQLRGDEDECEATPLDVSGVPSHVVRLSSPATTAASCPISSSVASGLTFGPALSERAI